MQPSSVFLMSNWWVGRRKIPHRPFYIIFNVNNGRNHTFKKKKTTTNIPPLEWVEREREEKTFVLINRSTTTNFLSAVFISLPIKTLPAVDWTRPAPNRFYLFIFFFSKLSTFAPQLVFFFSSSSLFSPCAAGRRKIQSMVSRINRSVTIDPKFLPFWSFFLFSFLAIIVVAREMECPWSVLLFFFPIPVQVDSSWRPTWLFIISSLRP